MLEESDYVVKSVVHYSPQQVELYAMRKRMRYEYSKARALTESAETGVGGILDPWKL